MVLAMGDRFPVRKLPRLADFDYSSPRIFFITLVCKQHAHLLGKVVLAGGIAEFLPTEIGRLAEEAIHEISKHYPGVEVLAYVVMPNHIHLLISLVAAEKTVNLSRIIRSFKTHVTKEARKNCQGVDLWQNSFYDHIVRDRKDYLAIGEYISGNVQSWGRDKYFED